MMNAKLGEAFEFETEEMDFFNDRQNEDDDDCPDFQKKLEDEAQEMLNSWNRELLMQEVSRDRELIMRNANKGINDEDWYDGSTSFSELEETMQPLEGGQVFIKITESKPEADLIKSTNIVMFDRIGYLEGEPMAFESSIHDGRPNKINLTEGPILPGLLLALLAMRDGERANILIKPPMAYGDLGCPPLVPGNSTLFYNIKIYKVWDDSLFDTATKMEQDHNMKFPLESRMNLVLNHKEAANKFLRDGYPRDALVRYKSAIKYIDEMIEDRARNIEQLHELLLTLLINSAITMNKLDMPKSATKMAKRALSLDATNLKAHYQIIRARIQLSDFDEALRWLEKVIKLAPNDNRFDQLKIELDSKISSFEDKRTELYKRMARGYFNSN